MFEEGNFVNGIRDEIINGVQCKVYYPDGVDPDNIDPNTQVALYMHGGSNDWASANDAISQLSSDHNNVQSIIIIPNADDRANDTYYSNVAGAYDYFMDEHNINQNHMIMSGHSRGYRSTFGTLEAYLKNHPDSEPASVFLLETSPYFSEYAGAPYDYNYELYKDNNTMFYSYTPAYDSKNANSASSPSSINFTYEQINSLTDHGCNVVNILHPYVDADHNKLAYHFFGDDIIDFANGGVMLPSGEFKQESQELLVGGVLVNTVYCQTNSDPEEWPTGQYRYIYQVRNPETGLWEEIDADKINTLDKIRNFFGIASPFVVNLPLIDYGLYSANLDYLSSFKVNDETVSNDSNVLLSNVNNVYNAISGSNFVANKYACAGTASTTPVPADIPSVVNNYFSSTSSLLCNLADFLTECVNAGAKLDETERNIGKDAETVNNVEAVSLGFASLNSILSEANTSNASNVSNVSDNNHNFERKPSDSDVQSKTENFSGVSGSSDTGSVWDEVFSGFDKVSSSDGKTSFYISNQ